jgi:hypothetical protein
MLVPTQSTCSAPCVQPRQQRHHVGHVGGDLVAHGVGQPVAWPRPPRPGRPRGCAACARQQGPRQGVEVAPLARQAVHAHHHVGWLAGRPTPSRPCGAARQGVVEGRSYVVEVRARSWVPGCVADNRSRPTDRNSLENIHAQRQDRPRHRLHQRHRPGHRARALARRAPTSCSTASATSMAQGAGRRRWACKAATTAPT